MSEICSIMDADRTTLYLVDHLQKEIWSKVLLGDEVLEIRQKVGQGLSGWVAEQGLPVNIPDVSKDDRFNPETDRSSGYKTKSMLTFPVFEPNYKQNAKQKVSAVIQVLNKKGNQSFDENDESLLESLCSQIAIAIHNATLFTQVKEKASELSFLYKIEKIASESEKMNDCLKKITRLMRLFSKSETASILLTNSTKIDEFTFITEKPDSRKLIQIKNFFSTYKNKLSQQKLHISNTTKKEFDSIVKSFALVPLFINEELIGTILITNKPFGFSKSDSLNLQKIASQVSRYIFTYSLRDEKRKADHLSSMGKMIATIVHDLRSPINNVKGYAELLADECDENERIEFSQIVQEQADSMISMTTEILDFAKGKSTILPRKVGVSDLISYFLRYISLYNKENNVIFTHENNVKFGVIYADIERLTRAFSNIHKNSIEAYARGKQPHFSFKVEEKDSVYEFQLSDTAGGIPKKLLPQLFDSFVTHGKEDGTGLGLAIVKKIVEDHNGTINVKSSKNGTTFIICLTKYEDK
jgi:signal transduction histidine kinase